MGFSLQEWKKEAKTEEEQREEESEKRNREVGAAVIDVEVTVDCILHHFIC